MTKPTLPGPTAFLAARAVKPGRRHKSTKISLSDDTKAVIKNDRVQPFAIPEDRASSLWKWLNVEAKEHDVAEDSQLVLATSVLFTLNSPAGLAGVYRAATAGLDLAKDADLERATHIANVMREAGLKTAGLNGLPTCINGLAGLRSAFDPRVTEKLPKEPRRALHSDAAPTTEVASRGAALFSHIYDPQTEKLIGVLGQNHPDMPAFVIDFEYGGLFAPPAPGYPVGREDTSVLAVSVLRAQGGVAPQVMSHVLGLRKAQTVEGATWLTTEEGARWLLKTVDGFVDRAKGQDGVKAKL